MINNIKSNLHIISSHKDRVVEELKKALNEVSKKTEDLNI